MKVLLDTSEEKEFPLCPKEFPDEFFSEEMAQRIHGQSLARLNERGGMSPGEMILNILKMNYRSGMSIDTGQCIILLCALKYSCDNEKDFLKSIK